MTASVPYQSPRGPSGDHSPPLSAEAVRILERSRRKRESIGQGWVLDIDIDYVQDARWGWIPSGWRVTEMLSDGSRRLLATAKVVSYSVNVPIGTAEFRRSVETL